MSATIDLAQCQPVEGRPEEPDAHLASIVGRCHVGESYTEVLRYVVSLLQDGTAGWRRMPRQQRRLAVAMIVYEHNANRELYTTVMSGGLR